MRRNPRSCASGCATSSPTSPQRFSTEASWPLPHAPPLRRARSPTALPGARTGPDGRGTAHGAPNRRERERERVDHKLCEEGLATEGERALRRDLRRHLVRGASPPPPSRTKWTRRVPHPVLIGHAASLTPY